MQCRARKVSRPDRDLFTGHNQSKVRCDGRPDRCRNCERLKFDCSFQPRGTPLSSDPASADQPPAQPERRRGVRACTECRSQKIRCPGDSPECANCLRRNRRCVYPALKRPTRTSLSSGTPPSCPQRLGHIPPDLSSPTTGTTQTASPAESLLPAAGEVISLVEAYFEHVYALPWYAFLHKQSVVQRCLEGTIEDCLALSICAVTVQRLKIGCYSQELCAEWIQKAEDFLLQNIGMPSTSRLQALILVVRFRVEAGQFNRAFMLAALAGRSAVALRLNYERPELRFLAQEVRRRLVWSCFALDGNFSVGLREFEICPSENVFLQLPCPETEFEHDTPVQTAPLRAISYGETERIGTYAACIRLIAIRKDVMR